MILSRNEISQVNTVLVSGKIIGMSRNNHIAT